MATNRKVIAPEAAPKALRDEYEDVENQPVFAEKQGIETVIDDDDYWGDLVLFFFTKFSTNAYKPILIGITLSVPASIFLFYVFISSSFSNIIAYAALVIALFFVFVSMGILGWILA